MKPWSNLAKVVYKRTYSRNNENWEDTVNRVIAGNLKTVDKSFLLPNEEERLRYYMMERKATPAGRGLWYSGAPSHAKLGGAALNNCWFFTADEIEHFVLAQDLLMLGGGVGLSVEHRFVSKLPKLKSNVSVIHKNTLDADFIVPDSREGWNELLRKVLEAHFTTGRSFSYSTRCVRGHGEAIVGFGGKASGPQPLIDAIEKMNLLFSNRAGKHMRPVDAGDLLCAIGELVVSGNVRRSAIILLGDAWDKEYLTAKRWDLGQIPTYRAMANFSVVCDDINDLHPLFWETYQHGEAFGLVNRKNIQMYGRMGSLQYDSAIGVNPCVTGDTEILTSEGFKSIETVVNKEIVVWNGTEWSEVTPKVTGTNQPLLEVEFSNGIKLACTDYHMFLLADGYKGKVIKTKAQDLVIGDKLAKFTYPVIQTGKTLPNAYTNGFIAAEGEELLHRVSVYKPKGMCLSRLEGVKQTRWSDESQRWCVTLDWIPESKNLVPLNYNLTSKLNWLAGLLDGDGTELKEGGCQLVSVNRNFLTNLQKLLMTLGVDAKVAGASKAGMKLMPTNSKTSAITHKMYFCQETWRICIGAVQMQSLKTLGLRCERLSFNKTPQRNATQFVKVTSIKRLENAPVVYCFNEPKQHIGCFNGIMTGQCGESTLENGEPCSLQEIYLPNLDTEAEFEEAARLMHRYGKRVTMEHYHNPKNNEVVKRNRRIGTGITGCLQSPLFAPSTLDRVYASIQQENASYSNQLQIPQSIRTTVIKPSGTLSLVGDVTPGIHPAYSKYYIRRVRIASNDDVLASLRVAGHDMEPVQRFDGSFDHNTMVVDFPCVTPDGTPTADTFDTWQQLQTVLDAQKHWADQAVSVTVYYKREDIPALKTWLSANYGKLKCISFLCHNEHGFKQAPLEAITEEKFDQLTAKLSVVGDIAVGEADLGVECEGACPLK